MNKTVCLSLFVSMIFFINIASAVRLPVPGGDTDSWGTVLNAYLTQLAGLNATELNVTGNATIGGNITVNGKVVIWSNGTVETGTINSYTGVTDVWVNTTGDTMTGELNISNKIYLYPNGTVMIDGDIHVPATVVIWSNGTVEIDSNRFYQGVDDNWVNESGDTINGNLIIEGNLTVIGDKINATVTNQYLNGTFYPGLNSIFDIGSDEYKWDTIYANILIGVLAWNNVSDFPTNCSAGYYVSGFDGNQLYCVQDNDNNTIYTGVNDVWINTTGDTMTGELNISSKIYLYPNGTILVNGNIRVPTTVVIWSNGTIETGSVGGTYGGVADSWVNTTGDTMTGNLTMGGNWIKDFITDLGWYNLTNFPSDCAASEYVFGIFANGTLRCRTDLNNGGYAGVNDVWVNTTGDRMTGDLNISDGKNYVNISREGSINLSGNITMNGNFSVKTGAKIIWSNGTVEIGAISSYTGVADSWVNITGDTMNGNLNITSGSGYVNITATTGNIIASGNLTVNNCIIFASGGKICDSS